MFCRQIQLIRQTVLGMLKKTEHLSAEKGEAKIAQRSLRELCFLRGAAIKLNSD
jgi:hypothetical protein